MESDKISEFVSITDTDEDRARFYLESAAWNLQIALASFFENGDFNEPPNPPTATSQPQPIPMDDDDIADPRPGARQPSTGSNFATLANYAKQESSSDEEEGEAFYAGGSERSGQQVLGPPKKKDDIVSKMFKSAKKHGAESVEPGARPREGSTSMFRGTAYRLGATEDDSQVIPGQNQDESVEPTEITLKMWKNGFSLDGGPLREYEDPANRDFLQSIRRGEIPRELHMQARGREVSLNMEDHRNEEFTMPKPSQQPFCGTGQMLGSPAPKLTSSSSQENSASGDREKEAREEIQVDENHPRTSIQVRLTDGTRLVASLNHSHTVHDLYRYVQIARPQYASINFALMTTFPNKELMDSNTSIQDANLLNAVVVQRIK